jgi:hypothetical protein
MPPVEHLREGQKQDPLVWSEKLDPLSVLKTEKKGIATNAGEWVQADRGAEGRIRIMGVQGKIPRTL